MGIYENMWSNSETLPHHLRAYVWINIKQAICKFLIFFRGIFKIQQNSLFWPQITIIIIEISLKLN